MSLPDETRYAQRIDSIRDLFQYAQYTDFQYSFIGAIKLSKEQAQMLDAQEDEEWIYAIAYRKEKEYQKNICITRLFLNPQLKGMEKKLRESKEAVYAIIEREFKVKIDRVEQEIDAVLVETDDAAILQVKTHSPALRVQTQIL
jgi:DNA-binding GntR family transcriptional regulator